MNRLTSDQLDELERLERDATKPGWQTYGRFIARPWYADKHATVAEIVAEINERIEYHENYQKSCDEAAANGVLIVTARNALPALIQSARNEEMLLGALVRALPFVEAAEHDPAYKPASVRAVSKLVRDAIAKAETQS